jgi:hypothetical protein
MKKGNGLIKFDDPKSIAEFLEQPTIKISEALTGVFASEISDLKLSAGKLVQASIKGQFIKQLGKELKQYIEKGKIKEDYFATNKDKASLYELLKFIDEEVPDEERFKAMKSIFFMSISNDIQKGQQELVYELMHICKQLNAGDILVLKSVYDIFKESAERGKAYITPNTQIDLTNNSASYWLDIISKKIGHKIPTLIEKHEAVLMGLGLLSPRTLPDKSGIVASPRFRLTELGWEMIDFITKY